MFGSGGMGTARCVAAVIGGMVVAGSLSACAYNDEREPRATVERSAISLPPAPALPAEDPDMLAVEKRNYAELDRRLAVAPGSLLLSDSGPANGPGVGFTKAATVKTPGPHTVTAACIGVPHAQIFLSQSVPGGTDQNVVDLDCTGVQTQTVLLHAGYIGAQLMRPDSHGAWTGAVAGIKITLQ